MTESPSPISELPERYQRLLAEEAVNRLDGERETFGHSTAAMFLKANPEAKAWISENKPGSDPLQFIYYEGIGLGLWLGDDGRARPLGG